MNGSDARDNGGDCRSVLWHAGAEDDHQRYPLMLADYAGRAKSLDDRTRVELDHVAIEIFGPDRAAVRGDLITISAAMTAQRAPATSWF